jgi:hypothetical protein
MQRLIRRHVLTSRVLPLVLLLILVKVVLHSIGWQPFELNTLISSMLAANVFLLGFLISGAMPDFKEAERLPGEMAASLDAIADECMILFKQKNAPEAKEALKRVRTVADGIHDWFHHRSSSVTLMDHVREMNDSFLDFESLTQANFIVRLKQEQTNLRRLITRVHTIRETTFVQTAYAVAEAFTALMLVTLVLVEETNMFTAVWFTGLGGFLLIYMMLLIHDLDNPFHYGKREDVDEIPLRPLEVVREKLKKA